LPFVDSYSVWRGPTNTIVNKHVEVFDALSFTFPVPGFDGGAKLGLPDLLFFALFLGAARPLAAAARLDLALPGGLDRRDDLARHGL